MSTTTLPAARMNNPAMVIPEAMDPIMALVAAAKDGGVSEKTLGLVHMRVSQINGCSACVYLGTREAKRTGESLERLLAVAAWRESPHFDDAERAALALAEAATRLSDRSDPVCDEVWEEAARHYDERQLASLLLEIGLTNLFNRFNVVTRQPARPPKWEASAA